MNPSLCRNGNARLRRDESDLQISIFIPEQEIYVFSAPQKIFFMTHSFSTSLEKNKNIEISEKEKMALQYRSQFAQLIANQDFRNTLDEAAIKGYDDMLSGNTKFEIPITMFEGTFKFAEKGWKKVLKTKKEIDEKIQSAIQNRIISKKDTSFYVEKLEKNIFNGKQIVDDELLEKALSDVESSLKKREDEKKEYLKLSKLPILKEGNLAISAFITLKFPDEKGFLELSVPERRSLLKAIEENLEKAKTYQQEAEKKEILKLKKNYSDLLYKARGKGIFGLKTIKKYEKAFDQLEGIEERKYWIQELENGNQFQRYIQLWQEVQNTLKGSSLAKIKNKFDQLGFSEINHFLEKEKQLEATQLNNLYEKKLHQACQKGWISQETKRSFLYDQDGMRQQNLQGKYFYLAQFDQQMARYRRLRFDIEQITEAQVKTELIQCYQQSGMGFTEIQNKYKELVVNKKSSPEDRKEFMESSENPLGSISDPTVKSHLIKALQITRSQGSLKQSRLNLILKQMIPGGPNSGPSKENNTQATQPKKTEFSSQKKTAPKKKWPSFNPTSKKIQDQIYKKRKQKINEDLSKNLSNELSESPLKTLSENTKEHFEIKMDKKESSLQPKMPSKDLKISEIKAQADQIKPMDSIDVIDDSGFHQVSHINKLGRQERSTLVTLNSEKSMENFYIQDQKSAYRSRSEGGSDLCHFAIELGNHTLQLKINEVKAFQNLLEKDLYKVS